MRFKLYTMTAVVGVSGMAVLFGPMASARDMVVPAGTILQCTLNEPNFSKATVEIGDPVLCHLRGMTEFGEQAFPHGSYLVGHLESAKDPGHFFGKGNLKLQFDRIGLPGGDMPVDAKIIATRGYKVDKEGKIRGKGHATRDVVEWMLPPLWPWKVIMLPARGPRPKLKGETTLSLRLMDDVDIPQVTPGYGRPMLQVQPQAFHPPVPGTPMMGIPTANVPLPRCGQTYGPGWHYFGQPWCDSQSDGTGSTFSPVTENLPLADQAGMATRASFTAYTAKTATTDPAPGVPLFVMKDGTTMSLGDYRYRDGRITYALSSGERGVIGWEFVDWPATMRLNAQRGVRLSLQSTGNLTAQTGN